MLKLWTPEILFNLNNIIIIGWLALIFAPFKKMSKYIVLAPAVVLSIIYSVILFQIAFLRGPKDPPLDFFHLSGWSALLKNPFMIVGVTGHFCVADLWLGRWMVLDFYSGYTFAYSVSMDSNGVYQMKKSWTFGRIIFSIILLLTYMVAPFGFLVYHLAKLTFLKKYKNQERIDFQNDQKFTAMLNLTQLQVDAFNRRSVRFGDKLPEPLSTLYHLLVGFLGLAVLFTIALPAYVALRIYCRIVYHHPPTIPSTTSLKLKPNKFVPDYVRNVTESMKFTSLATPQHERNILWRLKFVLLQLSTFIEYIPNSKEPIALFGALGDYFKALHNTRYYVFGDGIAVNSYALVKRYLQDIPPAKAKESLGWQVSTSQATFCDFTTIFRSSNDPQTELGRHIIFQWLHHFPYDFTANDCEARFHLARLVRRQIDQQPDDKTVFRSVGEVMFFLATGGELRKHERAAFVDCVANPMIFFPDWFNFLLAGHYLERKTLNSYYVLLQAFSRYADGPALRAAFEAGQGQKSKDEVLKLVAIVFAIAGSAAPAKLAVTVIGKLWSNKDGQKNVRLFKKNPRNFIKECARLDKVVPMVNVLATADIANEINEDFRKANVNVSVPINTPLHCSLVNANQDETVFKDPSEFLPDRSDLDKMIVWNGVEEDINNPKEGARPPRYCPGHDLSLYVVQYVAEQFLPVLPEEDEIDDPKTVTHKQSSDSMTNGDTNQNDTKTFGEQNGSKKSAFLSQSGDEVEKKLVQMDLHISTPVDKDQYCYSVLDNYTKVVMTLMYFAVKESNATPSRGSDIIQPLNILSKDLGIYRLRMAKFIPKWDEDEPKGSILPRRIARWLVNQNIWDFNDCLADFNTPEQAIGWRLKMFSALPLPNVIYEDMTSDKAMTQLAFAGLACHYTRGIENPMCPGCGIPDAKCLADAVYVNDMTGLSSFRVRKPFERYGAAAYFDKDQKIIAIYWSHASRLVKKGEQSWNHAKYVWRSTFFAQMTIGDHLIATHLIESNSLVTASRKFLPPNHPLRTFIKPFTYHTVSVNDEAATSLVNERGLVHRIWAFDYDEFLKVCDYISMEYTFRLLPEYIDPTMHPKVNDEKHKAEWDKIYPIFHDLNAFWKIIQNYVANFFRINYNVKVQLDDDCTNYRQMYDCTQPSDDKLPDDPHIEDFISEICKQLGIQGITSLRHFVDVLSQLIAAGTGVHEHVGQISDYMIDPRFIGAKLQEGKEMQNIQTYTQILVLSVVTGLRMPGLLEDWSHLIARDQYYSDNLNNYRNFKSQLRALSREIDALNKTRNYPFQSFNPRYMECSTSV